MTRYSRYTVKIMRLTLSLMLYSLMLILTACSSLQPEKAPLNQHISWKSRAQALASIQHWQLDGVIAVHQQQQAWSARWQWQQQANHYTLSFFGPLGSHAAKLTGYPDHVTLMLPDGKQYHAHSADTLLTEQLGWAVPVTGLYYWVRGLPAPWSPAQTQFDLFHHLTDLHQDGWHIQYRSYTAIQQIDVPSKLFLTHDTLTVKILISHWSI